MFETDLNGYDFASGIDNVERVDLCHDLCRAESGCKFWTYNVAEKRCIMKTSDAGKQYGYDAISGAHDCSPYHPDGNVCHIIRQENFLGRKRRIPKRYFEALKP